MNKEKKEITTDIENKEKNEINFTDYAPLDRDYTKEELAAIYKKIILDITKENE